jgi:hypothetical protein
MQAQMKDGSVIELVVDRAQDVAKVSPPRSPAIIVVGPESIVRSGERKRWRSISLRSDQWRTLLGSAIGRAKFLVFPALISDIIDGLI